MPGLEPSKAALLAEIEDLIRGGPSPSTIHHGTDEVFSWLGRVGAAISTWSPARDLSFSLSASKITGNRSLEPGVGYRELMVLLNQARAQIRQSSVTLSNIALEAGRTFDYFDEIRKEIEIASVEIMFIDPYLDAEFVSRYFPHINKTCRIRLLTGESKLGTLIPAVNMFVSQNNLNVAVRAHSQLHDRFLIIDRARCLQSGASFKDGARKAPTTLTEITDAFEPLLKTYEHLWSDARVVR